ncbi:hypothetical protein [Streptomyces sp. NPDC002205]|uniref:hypothetical protein n=1 Tax=Streptomyces sp. NPDC002205 TaxID=3154411 RepID=UPI003329BA67
MPGHDIEQAFLDQQLALTPQTRMRRIRHGFLDERVDIEIPYNPPVGRRDLPNVAAGNEPAGRILEATDIGSISPAAANDRRVASDARP